MPHEVLSSGIVSKSADVFAFGVLMWEIYMGQRAWEGMTPPQVMLAVVVKQELLQFSAEAPTVRPTTLFLMPLLAAHKKEDSPAASLLCLPAAMRLISAAGCPNLMLQVS